MMALVLLCSLALPVTAGAAGYGIELGYGANNMSGTGWTYTSQDRTLELNNYSGGPIHVTGDLVIYSYGNVNVTASGNLSAITAGANGYTDTDLQIYVMSGTMTVTGSGTGAGIDVTDSANGGMAGIGLANGSLKVNGGSNGMGIFASSIAGVISPDNTWTDSEQVEHYDGKRYTGTMQITGGYGRPGISAPTVVLDADGTVTGGNTAPAVMYRDEVLIGNNESGVKGSAVNLTLAAGSTKMTALDCVGTSENYVIGEHIAEEVTYFDASRKATPHTLKLYPKTYTTINGNGGQAGGESTVTLSQAYPYHVKLSDYAFTRQDYALTGYQLADGRQVAVDYEFIPAADTALTAMWQFTGKNNVSDQITFTQLKSEATYSGAALPLSDFVSSAALSSQAGAQFTYTLSKNGGAASEVTLSDTVTDAGTYTVTAKYEDADNIGEVARTFTIAKATPVITVPTTAATVIVGNTEEIVVSAKLAGSDTSLPFTCSSSDSNVATAAVKDGKVAVTGIAAGTATITVSCAGSGNVNAASKTFTVEIIDLPRQDVAFAESGSKTATYGDAAFTNGAVNNSAGGGAITYSSSDSTVAAVDGNGQVTILGAGETTITATAAEVPHAFARTSVSYTLTVAPKSIRAQASVAEKTYDGTTAAEAAVTFDGLVNGDSLTRGTDYSVAASFADANAGTGKPVSVTVTLRNTSKASNYTLSNSSITLNDGVIHKAPAMSLADQNLYVRYNDTSRKERSLVNLMPDHAGAPAYALGQIQDSQNVLDSYAVDQTGLFTFSLKDGLTTDNVGDTAAAPIIISSTNYEDSTVNMVVNVVYKFVPVAEVADITAVYTGEPVSDGKISGTALYDGEAVEGAWSFKSGQALTAVADSGPKVVVFTPDNQEDYSQVEATIMVTINKADPAGKPDYTVITSSGKTLADTALGVGSITPAGSISWDDGDDTPVRANTSYGWTSTPEDTDNYNILTGSIRLYTVSSGGSSSSSRSVAVKSSRNGTVTVSPKNAAKGDTVTITVRPDSGYELDELTVTDRSGNALKLTSKGENTYTFTMPAASVTVEATFQKAETASGSRFTDVSAGAYYYDAVQWAVENGITSGTTATTFAPGSGCTRGQVVTFLWRAAGQPAPATASNPFSDVSPSDYYYSAVLWAYENGITSGATATTFAPDKTCTRAQIVTFLWRAQGGAAADGGNAFQDVSSGAYYADAVNWAVENGVTSGTTATTFAPDNTCTRAQVVTFLYRCLAK